MEVQQINWEQRLREAVTQKQQLEALLELVSISVNEDFVEGWKYGNEALGLAQGLKDREAEAKSLEGMANCLWKLAEFTQALDNFESALDKYLSLGDLHGTARCYCGLGVISGIMEDLRMALEYFEDGLSAARRADRPHLAATLTGNIGHVYFKMGRYEDAMQCFDHGLEYYKKKQEHHGVANMLGGIAGIHVYRGEYDRGLEIVRRTFELHKKVKHYRGMAVTMGNIAHTLQKMGKLEEAFIEYKRALNYARSIQLKVTENEMLKALSSVCTELGKDEAAQQYLQQFMDCQTEEKKLAVKQKNEQFGQRQMIRDLQRKTS